MVCLLLLLLNGVVALVTASGEKAIHCISCAAAHDLAMTTRLQLHLSAKELKNLGGLMGKSDPFAVVTSRGDNANNKPVIVGQTDVYVFDSVIVCESVGDAGCADFLSVEGSKHTYRELFRLPAAEKDDYHPAPLLVLA